MDPGREGNQQKCRNNGGRLQNFGKTDKKRDLCVGKGVKPKVQQRERKSEREEGPLERGLVNPLAPLYP